MTPEQHLPYTQGLIRERIGQLDVELRDFHADRREILQYWQENRLHLDFAERGLYEGELISNDSRAIRLYLERDQLKKAEKSPFFGRMALDFGDGPEDCYVGQKGITDKSDFTAAVLDWRTPIAGLFYEGEVGPCKFQSPAGPRTVQINQKQQVLIREGRIESVVDVSDPVHDSLLLNYLEQNSTREMKTIVASLQAEQNRLIRLPMGTSVILSGPAGSGKTSVALHRAAYLLFQNTNLSADRILFLSPKKYLTGFISCVLPELDEDNIRILDYDRFFGDLTGQLDDPVICDLNVEEQFAVLAAIPEFADRLAETLRFSDIIFENITVPADTVRHLFEYTYGDLPFFARMPFVGQELREQFLPLCSKADQQAKFAGVIDRALAGMIEETDISRLYGKFADFLRERRGIGLNVPDSDLLLLLQDRFFERVTDNRIQYLIVDEMQDLSPFRHAVIGRAFCCPCFITGDLRQSEIYGRDDLPRIRALYPGQPRVERLQNCYRSTYEIVEFCKDILGEPEIVPIERHGDPVQTVPLQSIGEMAAAILAEHRSGRWNTVGLIVPDATLREGLIRRLREQTQVSVNSMEHGICVYEPDKVKGLEFDCVFVCGMDSHPADPVSRSRLYIDCTRALHKLILC